MSRGELQPSGTADPMTPTARLDPDALATAGAALFGGIEAAAPPLFDPRDQRMTNPSYSGQELALPPPPPRRSPDPPMEMICALCRHSWGTHWETNSGDDSGCAGQIDQIGESVHSCTCEVFAMPIKRSRP